MGKVFTITEGLENLGALKTGGQGSVFKARRVGEIISAVKMLPTPLFSEDGADKNYIDFKNEVQKLKRVNEKPNPHVVSILSHGITDSGSFPFIEMEFIDGPDLEEMLHPPHDPVFSIKEVIKVAEQLASALAHCHSVDVKHGDVKSNNVKFNSRTGNYMLLDFGLAVLSEEVRRTSLRRAGSVEFMAPEQSDGQLLFQSDVYGFGVIIFELLAGTVPFPLTDNTDTARNQVMLAQREAAPPDMLALRKSNLPVSWDQVRVAQEMAVPAWLQDVVYQCLEKDPEKRFATGVQLLDFICTNMVASVTHDKQSDAFYLLQKENRRLLKENKELQEMIRGRQGLLVRKRYAPISGTTSKRLFSFSGRTALITALAFALLLFILYRFNSGSGTMALGSTRPVQPKGIIGQYKVHAPRAYFYSRADENSRQGAYLIPSNDVVSALNEENDFIYTEFTSNDDKRVRGWLRKQDLIGLNELVSAKAKKTNVRLDAADIAVQLQDARQSMTGGQEKRALYIYNYLADQDVPEAMYEYGNLALKGRNPEIDCKKAYELVYKAGNKGYTPAKTVIGFLYTFGADTNMLQAENYSRCKFSENIVRGAQLLMEATLEGDTAAKRWLKELSQRQPIVQE